MSTEFGSFALPLQRSLGFRGCRPSAADGHSWRRNAPCRPLDDVADLIAVTPGQRAYRRGDGVAVIPLALLGS